MLCELSGDIKVNCEEVTFIDTAGFDTLDWGYVVATARGHTFAVVGLRGFQARVAELLRVPYGRSSRVDAEQAGERLNAAVQLGTPGSRPVRIR